MISMLGEFVHDWLSRCPARDRVIQHHSRCDFHPASADILPNRKNKRHSSRLAWDAAASCSESIHRKIGTRRSASSRASRNPKPGTRAPIQEELRSYPIQLWTADRYPASAVALVSASGVALSGSNE